MSESYDSDAIETILTGEDGRKRPWQLLMTSADEMPSFSPGTFEALASIFDLFPSLKVLAIKTDKGEAIVSRDFPSGYTERVDRLLAEIFRTNPEITGIVFPATNTREGHTATPDDPYWSADGKEIAALSAAIQSGEISPEEALSRLRMLDKTD